MTTKWMVLKEEICLMTVSRRSSKLETLAPIAMLKQHLPVLVTAKFGGQRRQITIELSLFAY